MQQLCSVFPKLRTLDLSENKIHSIEMICSTVAYLRLNSNPLNQKEKLNFSTIRKLTELVFLHLGDIQFTHLPADLFQNMTKLQTVNLINNLLVTLDSSQFLHNPYLVFLDISKNSLQNFDANMLLNVTALEILYLNNNKISRFDEAFINYVESTPSLKNLRIEGNSFDCSCGQLFFQSWVKRSKQLQMGDFLYCHQPESLQNKTIIGYRQPVVDCYIKWVAMALGVLVGVISISLVV